MSDPTPDPAPAEPTPTEPNPAPSDPQDVASLPAWAQKVITDTRAEAARYRTGTETAAQAAAQQAQQDLTDRLAVALGLKQDAAVDPAALTQSLTEAQAAKKQADIQLAVYRTASSAGGNPDALLDSNTFLAKVNELDPTTADFQQKVGEAITAAVAANSSLKQARAAGTSTVDQPAGSGTSDQITEDQLKTMTPEQIETAFAAGKLRTLMGA